MQTYSSRDSCLPVVLSETLLCLCCVHHKECICAFMLPICGCAISIGMTGRYLMDLYGESVDEWFGTLD